jgi:hypothetical protein
MLLLNVLMILNSDSLDAYASEKFSIFVCKSSYFSMPFMGEKLRGGTSAYPCPNEFKGNVGHLPGSEATLTQSDLY